MAPAREWRWVFAGMALGLLGSMGLVRIREEASSMVELSESGPSAEHLAALGSDDARPDLVLITLDDVGKNDLWDSTDLPYPPEMTRLKNLGVELVAYYGQSLCSPARATLMTGKWAHKIGFSDQQGGTREITAYSNWSVPLGHDYLPQGLKKLGYGTHMIGKWNIGHCNELYMPWSRGFDTFLGYFTDGVDYTQHVPDETPTYTVGSTSYTLRDMYTFDKRGAVARNASAAVGTYTTALFTDRATMLLEGLSEDAPLFMWLAYHGMHDNGGVEEAKTCQIASGDGDDAIFGQEATLDVARFKFGCALRAIDNGVGQVAEALEKRARDFVLVVHSDNGGWACGYHCQGNNYPLRGQKFFEFEGGVNVPAFVYSPTLLPEKRRGAQYEGLMHHVDWFDTFLRLGGTADGNYDGRDSLDLWTQISGDDPVEERAFPIIFAASSGVAAIRSGRYKYVFNQPNVSWFKPGFNGTLTSDSSKCDGSSPATQLFDILADPNEEVDLATESAYAQVLDDMNKIWYDAYTEDFWIPTFQIGDSDLAAPNLAFHEAGGYVTHWGCAPSLRD